MLDSRIFFREWTGRGRNRGLIVTLLCDVLTFEADGCKCEGPPPPHRPNYQRKVNTKEHVGAKCL